MSHTWTDKTDMPLDEQIKHASIAYDLIRQAMDELWKIWSDGNAYIGAVLNGLQRLQNQTYHIEPNMKGIIAALEGRADREDNERLQAKLKQKEANRRRKTPKAPRSPNYATINNNLREGYSQWRSQKRDHPGYADSETFFDILNTTIATPNITGRAAAKMLKARFDYHAREVVDWFYVCEKYSWGAYKPADVRRPQTQRFKAGITTRMRICMTCWRTIEKRNININGRRT
jgi:hypothetical protein